MSPASVSSLDPAPFAALGLSPVDVELYRLLLRNSGATLDRLAVLLGSTAGELQRALDPLTGAGLAQIVEGSVFTSEPEVTLSRLISEEARRLHGVEKQLADLQRLVPALEAEHLAATAQQGTPITVERIDGGDVVQLIRSLTAPNDGDLLWLRPDPWRIPNGQEINDWVKGLVRQGRRSRAIYPARVLELAPDVVRERTEAGERVRVLASVPFRLGVMGKTAALISEDFGVHDGRRLVIRNSSMVGALTLLFELLWERAIPVPGLEGDATAASNQRRLLLEQLASGAKDEQIARTLGLSLRTVRRRVADLLRELGVDSRFQGGVEAVRRGWY